MVFYGKRILEHIFRAIVFLLGWFIAFIAIYNLLPEKAQNTTALVILCICTAVIGGALAYFLDKFRKKYAIKLLAAVAGGAGAVMVGALFKAPMKLEIVIFLVGFGVGFYIGGMVKTTVECTLSALVGAGFFIFGVASYAGGFNATAWSYWAYFAGGVVLTLGGAMLQRYMFRDDAKEEYVDEDGDGVDDQDAMRDDEEQRICGCF